MNSWIEMNVNGEEVEVNDTDESNQEIGQINYKQQYVQLKKKLKLLLFVSKLKINAKSSTTAKSSMVKLLLEARCGSCYYKTRNCFDLF